MKATVFSGTRQIPHLIIACCFALFIGCSTTIRSENSSIENSLMTNKPNPQIALLLPAQGKLAQPSKAVRDGFMAAYLRENKRLPETVNVRFYDTSTTGALAAYEQAVGEGADIVIGPLSKTEVNQLSHHRLSVPTLSLNYTERATSNLYQFGLSPQDEAQQVAEKARSDGHMNALIIAPRGEWGQGIANAFYSQWQQLGGNVVGTMAFSNYTELGPNIQRLLHVNPNEPRSSSTHHYSPRELASMSNRRQDIDMIFLVALPSAARQIKPLLQFYYAGNIPTYSTSTIYSGNDIPSQDRDLNGVIFCDMPWIFQEGKQVQAEHQEAADLWPEAFNQYSRLYALGMDAFKITAHFSELAASSQNGINASTGVLHLDPQNRIHRELQWAQIQAGTARPIGP